MALSAHVYYGPAPDCCCGLDRGGEAGIDSGCCTAFNLAPVGREHWAGIALLFNAFEGGGDGTNKLAALGLADGLNAEAVAIDLILKADQGATPVRLTRPNPRAPSAASSYAAPPCAAPPLSLCWSAAGSRSALGRHQPGRPLQQSGVALRRSP